MKRQTYTTSIVKIAAMILLCGIASSAKAQFTFVSESAIYNPINKVVVFRIEFSQAPDFTTRDEIGRLANSFQYFIVGDPKLQYPENFDAIIRGEEISTFDIPTRNAFPPSNEPKSGGWGTIRGMAPYRLDGKILTISIQLESISDHSANGHFLYNLEVTEFGGLTNFVHNSRSSIAPHPSIKGQCINNGWKNFGFENQGYCIKFVNTQNNHDHRDK